MLPYTPSPLFAILGLAFIARAVAQTAVYSPTIVSCVFPDDLTARALPTYVVPVSDLNGGLGPDACADACRSAGYTYSLLLNVDYSGGPLNPPVCNCLNSPIPYDIILNGDSRTGSCAYYEGVSNVFTVYDTRTTFRLDFCTPVFPGANVPIELGTDGPNWPEPVPVKTASLAGPEQCFAYCGTNGYTAFQPEASGGTGWTCWCFDDISMINNPAELDDCAAYNAYYYRNTAVATASSNLRRRQRITDAFKVSRDQKQLCPRGLTACNVYGTKTFECIDTSSELESCGGCLHGKFGEATSSGVNCATLPGVKMGATTCANGRCQTYACRTGFSLVGGACLEVKTRRSSGRYDRSMR